MRFPLFVEAVSRRAGLPSGQAAAISRAVLQTMVERMTGDAPDDLVGQLPDSLDGYLTSAGSADPRTPGNGPAEFLSRVGERAGVDETAARVGTGAVFATLREAITVDEFRHMVARLPRDAGGLTGADPLTDV